MMRWTDIAAAANRIRSANQNQFSVLVEPMLLVSQKKIAVAGKLNSKNESIAKNLNIANHPSGFRILCPWHFFSDCIFHPIHQM